jgi:hypothetical protein
LSTTTFASGHASCEAAQRAREHEHRELRLRVPARADVGEDRVEVRPLEPPVRELAPHELDARRRGRVRRVDRRALRDAEVVERHLAETDLVLPEQRVAAEVQDARDLAARPVGRDHAHAVERLEAELARRDGVLVDEDDVLREGVDADALHAEHGASSSRTAAASSGATAIALVSCGMVSHETTRATPA